MVKNIRQVTMGDTAVQPAYSIEPARYAKRMVCVRCPSQDGFKTRAARLADRLARGRYSNREHAYIMSPAASERFSMLYAEGWDASAFTGELSVPGAVYA